MEKQFNGNIKAQIFFELISKTFQKQKIPYIALDREFNVIWYNKSARKSFRFLTKRRGVWKCCDTKALAEIRENLTVRQHEEVNILSLPGYKLCVYAPPPECNGEIYPARVELDRKELPGPLAAASSFQIKNSK